MSPCMRTVWPRNETTTRNSNVLSQPLLFPAWAVNYIIEEGKKEEESIVLEEKQQYLNETVILNNEDAFQINWLYINTLTSAKNWLYINTLTSAKVYKVALAMKSVIPQISQHSSIVKWRWSLLGNNPIKQSSGEAECHTHKHVHGHRQMEVPVGSLPRPVTVDFNHPHVDWQLVHSESDKSVARIEP